MTSTEWHAQWKRLAQFRTSAETNRDELELEWFAQLKHFHVDAVDHGITQLIGSAQDTFLPGLGLLKDYIHARLGRYDKTPGTCATCHGNTWIDVAPFTSNGMIYENVVVRCPDCGVPAPPYTEPNRREPLTSREHAEWRMGDAPRAYMPPGLEGKPWAPDKFEAHKAQMREAFEKLRIKLFGQGKDAA